MVIVAGDDALDFLQNIVTQDLAKLDRGPIVHSCLLTAQGKFLHDFWISRADGQYLLICEGGARAEDLAKRLNFYKLRRKIEITLSDTIPFYHDWVLGLPSLAKPTGTMTPFEVWDYWRIVHGQADGSRDAEIEKSTLAELNLEDSAVDFNKGCYVGQELTARVHHRGLVKKNLVPLTFHPSAAPARNTPLVIDGQTIGDMRSSCGSVGLGLITISLMPLLKEQHEQDKIRFLGP